MKDTELYIYNVGHGVCTLMTGKRDDTTPYCGIFDCGSKAFSPFCERKLIIQDMKAKIYNNAQGHPVQIDEVVISHQDVDHWSMLLDLFLTLNCDTYVKYAGTFFGGENIGWKLTTSGLYTIIDEENIRTFKKRGYGENSNYTATLEYIGEDLLTAEITVFVELDNNGWCQIEANYNKPRQLNIIVTYKSGSESEEEEEEEEPVVTPIDLDTQTEYQFIDSLIKDWIIPYFKDDRNIRGVLNSIAFSFREQGLINLAKEREDPDTFITIFAPIKRIVMGGAQIEQGYALIKDLFFDMSQVYGNTSVEDNPAFLWETNGAFIIMDSDTINVTERHFPEYNIDINWNDLKVIRNLTSVVVQFNAEEDNILLLPGDVTQHGFQEISDLASNSIPNDSLKLMLAPHHGSDNTNLIYDDDDDPYDDEDQPLCTLFESLLGEEGERNRGCNLAISGYNGQNLHPGLLFTETAEEYFDFDTYEHGYACAYIKYSGTDLDDYEESLFIDEKGTASIFTTNILPISGSDFCFLYMRYCDGHILFDKWDTLKPSNLKRRLPPDSVFI